MSDPNADGLTSLSLLDRLRNRAPEAWGRFVKLYGPLVYGWCRRAGLQPADSADVCQNAFGAVSRAIGQFRHAGGMGAFRGWLHAITRNCIRDHFRNQTRQPTAAGGSDAKQLLDAVPDPQRPDPEQEAADTAGLVQRALDLLRPEFTEQTWQAFFRVALGGALPADVGAQLGISAFAVRQANFRVRRRLREELGDLDSRAV